jgi:hypothetical protein
MDFLNIIKTHKKPIIITSSIVVLAIIIIWILTAFRHNIMNTGALYLNTAPSGAAVTIDGKNFANGEHTLGVGSYTIEVSKDGFEAQIVDFVIEVGKDTIVTIALNPISEDNTWYVDHPDDDRIYTQAADQNAEIEQAEFLEKYPIMNYIPYTETNYDNPLEHNRFKIDATYDRESINLQIFLNTCSNYSTEIYKQAALDWLNSKGIDLSLYEIEFTTLCG